MANDFKYAFLSACQETVYRQQELVPALAESLGVPPTEVFYQWVMQPRCEQRGTIIGTEWRYFFHGRECDLKHSDGKFLRVDFGPGGRFDTFSGWGILQFVMTSKAPWQEFPELRVHLAKRQPPFDELSGSHEKMTALVSELKDSGLVEVIDIEPYSEKANDPATRAFWDRQVRNVLVISERGKQALKDGGIGDMH
jgi:hypothetical protein